MQKPFRVSTLADRLKQALKEQNLRQKDLLELAQPYCKLYNTSLIKTDISQYVLSKVEPRRQKLQVLAAALDVSEGWLSGFDVPRQRTDAEYTLDELLDFEARVQDVNDRIVKQVGTDLNVLFYRATQEDRDVVLNVLKKYAIVPDYINNDGNGYLNYEGIGHIDITVRTKSEGESN